MAWHCHERAEVLEIAGWYDLSIFPIASPGHADLWRVGRHVVKELAGIVIFCKVGQTGGRVGYGEMGAIEGAGEVLADAAAQRSPRIDADLQNVHLVCRSEVGRIQGIFDGGVGEHRYGD